MKPALREITQVPLYADRFICRFCGVALDEKSGINVCSTAGLIVLACNAHAEHGDALVQHIQLIQYADSKIREVKKRRKK